MLQLDTERAAHNAMLQVLEGGPASSRDHFDAASAKKKSHMTDERPNKPARTWKLSQQTLDRGNNPEDCQLAKDGSTAKVHSGS